MKKSFTGFRPIGWLAGMMCVLLLLHAGISKAQSVNFTPSGLKEIKIKNPTSLQFGPDGRLYVSQQDGIIRAYTIKRNGKNDYTATATETISLINKIPNHNDDGSLNNTVKNRQITGILVTGTAEVPVIYVGSSDSRIGGPDGDLNVDTNSGIVSRLTKTSDGWDKVDLIRALPRSEENHANNGMQLDKKTNTLYVAVGGFTNAGAPSTNFAYITEYAWAAAIIAVDLGKIDALPTKGSGDTKYKYDLPTLDDPTRPNNADGSDLNDPFGGNDGLNQAKITTDGPVKIYSTGYRNAYDLVITQSRKMYTVDNGANQGWGGGPDNEGTDGKVTNKYVKGEPGSSGPGMNDPQVNNLDGLHYIGNIDTYVAGSYYAGHPNPIRANPAGAGLYTRSATDSVWRNSKTGDHPLPADWPPVPLSMANPIEGDYQNPGETDNSLLTFPISTNGIAEYTASNFNNAMKGNLLAACWNGRIYRIKLNEAGDDVLNKKGESRLNQDAAFAQSFGSQPLDVIAQGDNDVFPGSIWAATYGADAIMVFEPADFAACTGEDRADLDDDGDGYSNADEIDNQTDPCSAASMPADADGDKISDINDDDDDNDKIRDDVDLFAIDAKNGLGTSLPVSYELFNNDPGTGFFGLGFTGLMTNKKAGNDYLKVFDENNLIAGGAVGAFSIVKVSAGTALGAQNDQENAFQFGINVNKETAPFTVRARILGSFFNNRTPQDGQSQGIYIGTGDQDNYLKVALNGNKGKGGIEVMFENEGKAVTTQVDVAGILDATTIDLLLAVNPATGNVQPKYAINGGTAVNAGDIVKTAGTLLASIQNDPALAVGIIASSGSGADFTATWDYIRVTSDAAAGAGSWQALDIQSGAIIGREENAFVQAGDQFYLLGGRGVLAVQAYDPVRKTWENKAKVPMELHHFQAVVLDGLIYVVGALTGNYPRETPVPNVYIYNPLTDKWTKGRSIPEDRRRGSAGVVVYNKKLYIAGGILDGHWTGHVPWLDEYDPAANTWKELADAPRARDHFQAAVVNNKLYAAGGRRSSGSTGEVFSLTVPEVDVYDFGTGKWNTLPAAANIPTQRAGAGTAVLDDELIIIGGESPQPKAHNETEALNVNTNTWRKLANLKQGRHGSQPIVNNRGIYVATGAGNQGGSPLLTNQEVYFAGDATTPVGTALKAGVLESVSTIDFGKTTTGRTVTKSLKISNTTGNQAIVITALNKTGDDAFTYTSPAALPFVIGAGGSISLEVQFKPTLEGAVTGAIEIKHTAGDGTSTIALTGATGDDAAQATLYRINCGGPAITLNNKQWSADQYFTGGKVYSNAAIKDIAGTTSDELYKSERSGDTPFSYSFPVKEGVYRVHLHFAEIYWGATDGGAAGAGKRVFDVNIEGGAVELEDFDIYKEAGAMKALVKSYTAYVRDGNLDIAFEVGKNQPKISAIEIESLSSELRNQLAANKELLYFFSQQAGSVSQRQTVRITNVGDEVIDIRDVRIAGVNGNEFVLDSEGSSKLGKGVSSEIAVLFKPQALGARVATLQISYADRIDPLEIMLTGEGTDNPAQDARLVMAYPNPNLDGHIAVSMAPQVSGDISYELVSSTGAVLAKGHYGDAEPGATIHLDFSQQMQSAGIYLLHVTGPQVQQWIRLVHE
ncbi:malectin domain-containing carbohydrate-binding protein [Dyadobacter sandarakinus]|uniref:Choice-of-anchor D domain-containing protein n=1 Tax=Dyadobacter sandarakinus TaxID=2747268 RepID=A0ABX7I4W6_9BACT|nr:malectin domain-containing carbohydrate-binding protein [Dyadobacter sandarakinus]QRR00552.1 choice-of-anchor D domain-containing protein [Dyadobacter sandarakinus]